MEFIALPTGRGVLFLLLASAACAVAVINAGLLTALTAACFSALVISSFLMTLFSFSGIALERKFLHRGVCGDPVPLEITVRNRLPFFRQSFTVTERYDFSVSGKCVMAVPALAPYGKMILNYSVKAEKRGEFMLDKVYLRSGDPFGLFRKTKLFSLPEYLEIQPEIFPLESLYGADVNGGVPDPEGRNQGVSGRGTEFFGVRPYRMGDEVRHIHWKSTASQGRLMVKEFEAAAVDQIVILLDTGRKSVSPEPLKNNFEFLVSCAASLAHFLEDKYCHLRFIAADDRGGLHHISGDIASVKNRVRQVLTLIRESGEEFASVLPSAVENIPPRSRVFLLTMSTAAVPEYIRILEEQDCSCLWLYAPAELFPPAEPDKPRKIRRERVMKKLQKLDIIPFVADFTSGAEILEGESADGKS